MSWLDWSKPLLLIAAAAAVTLAACGQLTGAPAQNVPGGDPDRGRGALQAYGCGACHSIPGVPGANATVGPPLDHWASRRFIGGELPNEPDSLIKWIMNPQSVEPGTAMPNLNVDEAAARDITAYLYTIQ